MDTQLTRSVPGGCWETPLINSKHLGIWVSSVSQLRKLWRSVRTDGQALLHPTWGMGMGACSFLCGLNVFAW